MAGWVLDMFCNFITLKNHEVTNNSTTTYARDKIESDLESLELQTFLMNA